MAQKNKVERLNRWLTLGANIGVVLGLIILIVEVRQNTVQARTSASQKFLSATSDLNLALIENKQMASVFRRGLEDYEVLDADEKMQFFVFVSQYYQTYSNMYDLWRNNSLSDSAWYPIRKDFLALMAAPGSRYIWETYGREGQAPDFVAYMETLAASGEGTYPVNEILEGKMPKEKAKKEPSK